MSSIGYTSLYLPGVAINWCEEDYAVTGYIAEFWNTLSNVFYIIFAIRALRTTFQYKELPNSFRFFAFALFFTGIFSAFFHGTLWLVGQRLDEIFENTMLIAMFHILRMLGISPRGAQSSIYVHSIVAAAGIVSMSMFLFCEVHLVGIAVLSGKKLHASTEFHAKMKQKTMQVFLLIITGALCWLLDRLACVYLNNLPYNIPNPQLHSFWHLLTAFGLNGCFDILVQLQLLRMFHN